jgi:N-acetylglucosamine-6-sulfatase
MRSFAAVLSRLSLLGITATLGIIQTAVAADPASAKAKRPNIVFLFSDDHAFQAIGAYGSKVNQTPRLDQLAKQGMIFDRSFCANSICGPSRACILTGKHSHLNGFLRNGDRFDGSQTTLPKLLQQAGYQTAMIGKWHLESDPTGFDHWEVLPGQGHYYNPVFLQKDGSRKQYEGYCTDLIGDFSIEWLEKRDPDRPFFLMSQHKAPHRNWAPHPRHFGKYKLGTIPEPATLFDDYSGRSSLLKENEMSIRGHFHWGHDMKFHGENLYPQHFLGGLEDGEYNRMNDEQKKAWDAYYEPENQDFLAKMKAGELSEQEITRWKYQRYMHDYLGCVAAVDENVGRILDYLDERGLSENTIVVYASDQGFYLGEHGWYDKRWMYEESLRMPLIVRWPGVARPDTRSGALVQNIDYAPTILEAAGVAVPTEMQGQSFVPVLKQAGVKPKDWREAIYYAYYENDAVHMVPMHDGVRTERYKAMYFPRTREWNLFDLETDPQELKSVHADPQYATILQYLQSQFRELKTQYQVNSATIPASRGDEPNWKKRDQAKRAEAKSGGFDLVFLGDSITQGWEGAGKGVWQEHFGKAKALNLGFGGDRTEHLLWRLTTNQMGPSRPKAAVILIGTNNTGHLMQAPEEIAAGVTRVVETLRQKSPKTKVLLLGVLPRGANAQDPMRVNNERVNAIIGKLADGETVVYKDISQAFLEADGSISKGVMPDLLHLSAEGYRRWAEAIVPTLQTWKALPEPATTK